MRRKLKITKMQTAETMYVYLFHFFSVLAVFFVGWGCLVLRQNRMGKRRLKHGFLSI